MCLSVQHLRAQSILTEEKENDYECEDCKQWSAEDFVDFKHFVEDLKQWTSLGYCLVKVRTYYLVNNFVSSHAL